MMSPFYFLVSPKNKRYNTDKDLGDGKSITLSTSIENAKDVSREGIVKALPIGYSGDIKVGDEVIIHHNIFRDYYNYHGKVSHGTAYLFDNLFLVENSQIYLYKRDDCWKTNLDYLFIQPIMNDEYQYGTSYEEKLVGKVEYGNVVFPKNMKVGFTPESEYEFKFNNEKGENVRLYRMRNSDVCLSYEGS